MNIDKNICGLVQYSDKFFSKEYNLENHVANTITISIKYTTNTAAPKNKSFLIRKYLNLGIREIYIYA